MKAFVFILSVMLGVPHAVSALEKTEMRTWTSTGGKTASASLVGATAAEARLRTVSGKVITVRISTLSQEDQEYIKGVRSGTVGSAASTRSDWPGWRGVNRDGKSMDGDLLKTWPEDGPKLLWKNTEIGGGFSSVAVAQGTIYITGAVDEQLVLTALDMRGKVKWKVSTGSSWTKSYPGSRSTPSIDGEMLYLLSGQGTLTCRSTKDGQELWKTTMSELGGSPGGWGYAESPLVLENAVIVSPGKKHSMVALDKKTGKTLWESEGNGGSAQYSSAIHINHQGTPMLINGNRKGIFAVDPTNGELLWSNDFSAGNTANCPTPAYASGYVFWANGYGKGAICLKLKGKGSSVEAEEAWRSEEMVSHHGGYIIEKGYIYGNHAHGWACLELATGKVKWDEKGVGKGSLCYADGMLYTFAEKKGKVGLVRCTPDGFEIEGRFSVAGEGTSWAHPVVVGKRLYLRYASNLYCFDVKK